MRASPNTMIAKPISAPLARSRGDMVGESSALDTIPPSLLGPIQRGVRRGGQVQYVADQLRAGRDPTRRRQRMGRAAPGERLLRNRSADTLGDFESFPQPRARQPDRELFAADPRDEIAIAHRGLEQTSDMLQRGIAGGVPERVVELFEVVEIDVDERRRSSRSVARRIERALELAPVAQTGERIHDSALLRFVDGLRCSNARTEVREHRAEVVEDRGVRLERRAEHYERADNDRSVEQRVGCPGALIPPALRYPGAGPEHILGPPRGDGYAERDRAGDRRLMGKLYPAESLVRRIRDRDDPRLIGRDRQGNSAMRELRRELHGRARRALERDRAGGQPGHASGDDARARSCALLFPESHAGDETPERRGELIDARVVE